MVRRRISEAQRWQIIGMDTTGMFFKAIGRQMGYHYTVVSRLVRKHTQTNNVKDLPRSGRPRATSDRDDRALQRLIWRCHSQPVPYSNNTGYPIDVCQLEQLETVWNQRDLSQGVNKRPLLVERHRRTRLAWCLARRGWNLRTWRKIHWSDESRFLLHVTDYWMRVWTHKNTAYTPKEHQANCPLWWRLSNSLGVYLSWLQAGFSHHTRQPNSGSQTRKVKKFAKHYIFFQITFNFTITKAFLILHFSIDLTRMLIKD